MTTALATTNAPSITAEQMLLITKTVAKDATPDELKLYLYDCARQGVHPLDKLIHFTKRGGKYTPVTSIDFMRIQAADSGECIGIGDPVFEAGAVGGPPAAATVTVKRLVQGHEAYFTATARWMEYCPASGSDHMWRKMPHTMLGKCAEALALRKGFPKQLAGLYSREEMDQAGADTAAATVTATHVQVTGQTTTARVDTSTGEVIEAAQERPKTPANAYYIDKCEPHAGTGRKKGSVTVSWWDYDGSAWQQESLSVWEDQLFTLASAVCQEGVLVTVVSAPSEKWGPTLKGLKRYQTNGIPAPRNGEPPMFDENGQPF